MPCYKFIGLKTPWNQGFMAVRRCRSALALVYARNPIRMHCYEKRARKSRGIHSYKTDGLKVSWNHTVPKKGGGGLEVAAQGIS
jgi:hypothetical protein